MGYNPEIIFTKKDHKGSVNNKKARRITSPKLFVLRAASTGSAQRSVENSEIFSLYNILRLRD
jgi:hypothetical protein